MQKISEQLTGVLSDRVNLDRSRFFLYDFIAMNSCWLTESKNEFMRIDAELHGGSVKYRTKYQLAYEALVLGIFKVIL